MQENGSYERAKEIHLLKRIVKDIKYLFDREESENDPESEGALWDDGKITKQGVNYADLI